MLVELCEMMEMMKIQHNPHSSFLREPHQCPFLDPVDLSHRPLVPTVQYVKEFCRDQVTSALFSWRGANVMGTSGTLAPTTSPAAPLLSVAVSATWSFGIVKSTEFPNTQVMRKTSCLLLLHNITLYHDVCVCVCVCVSIGFNWHIVWKQRFRSP